MSWVRQVHAKAHILQGQIENLRRLAIESGIDPEAVSAQLYVEIENLYATEFLLAKAMDESDLVFHIEGSALRDHTPRLSLIESVFANIRHQVFKVANAVAELGDGISITDRDVELSLAALAPGSLYIGIKAEPPEQRNGQIHLIGETDEIVKATREAMRSIGAVSQHLDDGPGLRQEVPDEKVRDAAFVAVANLAPTGKLGVSKITISSSKNEKQTINAELTPKIRKELRRQLRGADGADTSIFMAPSNHIVIRGEIRELDLDFGRFELRRVENFPKASIRCILLPIANVQLASLAGKLVQIVGTSNVDTNGLPKLIHVENVHVLPPELPAQTGNLIPNP